MLQQVVTIIENIPLAERTFRIRLAAPEIANVIQPGQFLMLRLSGTTDPLLGRPFALYDIVGDAIDIVYLVVGKMTALLAEKKMAESIEIWGPLGNGFPDLEEAEQITLVAGGIGQTPFLAYARQILEKRSRKVALYYGVRHKSLAACVEDFQRAGVTVHLASDDGSIGQRGYVTDLVAQHNPPGPWVGCGPEPMLHSLRKLAEAKGVRCFVSLETPMACGFGACFTCVTKVKTHDGWDYKRVCVDGPVFDAAELA